MSSFLTNVNVYFVGIGGIGVSALAKYAHRYGCCISGTDLVSSEITDDLTENFGAQIAIGIHECGNLPLHTDLVIHSPAVDDSHPDIKIARNKGIELLSYPEVLGVLSKQKTTIAVSGTNGKSTTTTMVAECLENLGVNPDVIVGATMLKYNSNFLPGNDDIFVVEACEYKRSFQNIHFDIAVITNITEDHLECFGDISGLQSAFIDFIRNYKTQNERCRPTLVCDLNMENLAPVVAAARKYSIRIIDYSKYLANGYSVKLPGEHNRQNMAAALAVVEALEMNVDESSMYLRTQFCALKRRFEYVGKTQNGALVYDDYAHTHDALEHILMCMRSLYPDKKIVVIFQPHLYSRTELLKENLAASLSNCDALYLLPVFKAREASQPDKDFLLAESLTADVRNKFECVKDMQSLIQIVGSPCYNGDWVVLTVGAGDVWRVSEELLKT